MFKRKHILLLLSICIVFFGICSFVGIHYCSKNKITFIIKDTLPDGNNKCATVILLGGQSNASGCSLDEYLRKNVSKEKYEQYQNGYDNVYINYLSGLNLSQEFVKCSTLQGELEGSFGPELGLAEKLNEMYPDEMFFIIKCAWGGTDLFSQWLSPSSSGKVGKLYKQFVVFVETSIKYLISKNYDIKIKGMCWMQGESDSFMVDAASNYGVHLENLISDLRKKFSKYSPDEGFAFVDAYIAANPAYWVYYELVNKGKLEVSKKSHNNILVDTISNGLVCNNEPENNPDMAHYDSLSQIKLGHLFAEHLFPFLD